MAISSISSSGGFMGSAQTGQAQSGGSKVWMLYLFYVVPMSLIPPAMVYYAGTTYGPDVLPGVTSNELLFIAALFFLVELAVVPAMAWVIQKLGKVIEVDATYADAFRLAAIAPTPLWIAPLCLFIPNLMLNITASALGMMGAAALIHFSVGPIFKLGDSGKTLLMVGSILAAGLVAWVSMLVAAFVTWGGVVG